jgi:uncharacterized protein (DUF2252 family)
MPPIGKRDVAPSGGYAWPCWLSIDKGKAERHCLMDVKEAIAPTAPHAPSAKMPHDNAQRVIAGASNLSPFLGDRMVAGHLMDISVFVRELLPQDLKVEIEHLSRNEAMEVAEFLARVVGRGHARQMDAAGRKQWMAELRRNRSKSLDAPSWLWSSVVELIAAHEAAYLQHCRRYALTEAS